MLEPSPFAYLNVVRRILFHWGPSPAIRLVFSLLVTLSSLRKISSPDILSLPQNSSWVRVLWSKSKSLMLTTGALPIRKPTKRPCLRCSFVSPGGRSCPNAKASPMNVSDVLIHKSLFHLVAIYVHICRHIGISDKICKRSIHLFKTFFCERIFKDFSPVFC